MKKLVVTLGMVAMFLTPLAIFRAAEKTVPVPYASTVESLKQAEFPNGLTMASWASICTGDRKASPAWHHLVCPLDVRAGQRGI